MGRRKIEIKPIQDERSRLVTFAKRKQGILRKAYELSILCQCEVALIIFSKCNRLYQYGSSDITKILALFSKTTRAHESLSNVQIAETINKKNKVPAKPDGYSSDSLEVVEVSDSMGYPNNGLNTNSIVSVQSDTFMVQTTDNSQTTIVSCPTQPPVAFQTEPENTQANTASDETPQNNQEGKFIPMSNPKFDKERRNLVSLDIENFKKRERRPDFEGIQTGEHCPQIGEIPTPKPITTKEMDTPLVNAIPNESSNYDAPLLKLDRIDQSKIKSEIEPKDVTSDGTMENTSCSGEQRYQRKRHARLQNVTSEHHPLGLGEKDNDLISPSSLGNESEVSAHGTRHNHNNQKWKGKAKRLKES